MTVAKAIALWKRNSEVMGIEGQMENNHRNNVLRALEHILSNHIETQNMMSFNAMLEHSQSKKRKRTQNLSKFYKHVQPKSLKFDKDFK
jgi:hypothetical protein